MRLCLVAFMVTSLVLCRAGAQENEAEVKRKWAPPKRNWEWDEDKRFNELMEQLAINEASLDAVEAAVTKKTRRKASQQSEARRQDANTRLMDSKGGGPMKWDEFYGTNAEKFFYHPVDPNTTYRTDTFLRQMGKGEDDKSGEDTPSRQSLPVHQRPPQWDYIYRANRTARDSALADASLAESEIEQLEQRRTELEREQAVLWCKLAFRAVQRLNVARKPVLRFQLISAAGTAGNTDQVKALSAAARFLATSLAVVEKAEKEQSVAFGGVATVVTQARESFEDSLLEVPDLESEWGSIKTDLGKFYELSRLLADKAKTLAESFAGAMDGDMNKEVARKERFRGMLQKSVVEYAQILLALNELTDKIKTDWKLRVDTKQKVEPLQVAWGPTATLDRLTVTPDQDAPSKAVPKRTPPKKPRKPQKIVCGFRNQNEAEAFWSFDDDKSWRLENGGIGFPGWEGNMVSKQSFEGDLTVSIVCSGRELIVKVYGEEFRGEGVSQALLERRGNVLMFSSNKAAVKQVLLKKSQVDAPTNIYIGHHGTPFFLRAVTITGSPVASEQPDSSPSGAP